MQLINFLSRLVYFIFLFLVYSKNLKIFGDKFLKTKKIILFFATNLYKLFLLK